MRVLVTGAAGLLGWHTTAHLHKIGFDVVATDVLYRADMPVKLHLADLLDRHAAYRLLEGCDTLVHLGNHPNQHAVEPIQRLYIENVAMNINVIQAALDMGVKRIFFASSVQVACSRSHGHFPVEGVTPKSHLLCLPFDTATPALSGNHYALSKEASEKMLDMWAHLNPGHSFTSVRFPALVSQQWQWTLRRRYGADGFPFFLDEGLSYMLLDDAVELTEQILRVNRPGHTIIMPSANDNRLGLCAADLLKIFYRGVPLKKPIAPDARTVYDLEELKTIYNWFPKLTVPNSVLPPELQAIVDTLLK